MAINRDKVLAAAIKLLQGGKYEKAISEFQKLVEDDPKDVRTILKIGDTHVKMGHREDAIKNYERVATIYSEQGFYLKAVAVYKQMLRVDSNLPDVHLKLAEMYQQLGLISDSLQHYQQVAYFYEQQGKQKDTLQILRRMTELDPDNLPSRIKLAELFAQQGMTDDAVSEFKSAAQYLKEHERFDDYIRVAERLIYFDPGSLEVTLELSKLYLQRGEAKIALGKLQVCFKADPRNIETLTLIAQAFLDMQQIPKTISVYKEMARIHEGQNRVDDAHRMWRRVLELDATDGEAKQALEGPPRQAAPKPVAAAAGPVAPADPNAEQIGRLLTETDVYVKYGLRDKAIEHLQKIFALRPDHVDAHDKLRALHQQMNNRDGALGELRTLVRLGEASGDGRTAGWRRDLDKLSASAPVAPRLVAAAPPPEEDEMLLVEDHDDLLLDPEIADEPSLLEQASALPPDEDISSQIDAMPVDEYLEDAMVSGEEPHGREVLSAADEIGEELLVPAGAARARDDFAEGSMGLDAYDAVEAFAQAGLDSTEGQGEERPGEFSELSAEGFSIEDADALVKEALKGMEGLEDEMQLGEPSFEPIGDEASIIRTGDILVDDLRAPAPLEVVEPVDLGADLSAADLSAADLSATAVAELSPAELEEISRAVKRSAAGYDDGSGFDSFSSSEATMLGGPVGGASAGESFDDVPEFADATMTTARDSHKRGTDERSANAPLLTEPGALPHSSIEEVDLDQVAAAAAAGIDRAFGAEHAGLVDARHGDPSNSDDAVPAPPPDDMSRAAKLGTSDAAHGFEDDPASQFFADEVEEAEFFIRQELYDEAKEILTDILDQVDSPRATWMLARIEAKESGEPEPPAPWAERLIDDIGEVAAELGDVLDDGGPFPPDPTDQVSALEVLSAFKKGVKEQVSDDDADTHYNLGIAYREMGLLDDAIAEFRLSAESDAKRVVSLHLIGLTMLDQGKLEEALASFTQVLALPSAKDAERAVAEYQSGVCLESLSRLDDAMAAFKRARDLGAQLADLEPRISKLSSQVGNGKKNHSDDEVGFSHADEGGARRKNIDYV